MEGDKRDLKEVAATEEASEMQCKWQLKLGQEGLPVQSQYPQIPMQETLGDPGSMPGWGWSPGEGIQYSCLGKAHGQRSLVGYSPRGQEESDTTGHNSIPKVMQKNLAFQLKKF